MWQIRRQFDDIYNPSNKGLILLKSDKALNPYYLIYPIKWTGYIGGKRVIIVQKDQCALSESDFEFIEFPVEYNNCKYEIIEAIDKCLRIMD